MAINSASCFISPVGPDGDQADTPEIQVRKTAHPAEHKSEKRLSWKTFSLAADA